MMALCILFTNCFSAFASNIEATFQPASYHDIAMKTYSRALEIENGVIIAADASEKYGFIDLAEQVIMPFQYDFLEYLIGDLYSVKMFHTNDNITTTEEGMMNVKGEFIIPLQDNITIRMTEYQQIKITTQNGSDIEIKYYNQDMIEEAYFNPYDLFPQYKYYSTLDIDSNKYYLVSSDDGTSGIYDENLNILIPTGTFQNMSNFYLDESNNLIFVACMDEEKVWSPENPILVNQNMEFLTERGEFTSITSQNNGFYFATKLIGDEYHTTILDQNGTALLPFMKTGDTSSYFYSSQEIFGYVNENGYISVYDEENNNTSIYKDFELVKVFENEHVSTSIYYRDFLFSLNNDNEHFGLKSLENEIVLDAQYRSINYITDEFYFISKNTLISSEPYERYNETFGIATKDGEILLNCDYTYSTYLGDGKVRLYLSGQNSNPTTIGIYDLYQEKFSVPTETYISLDIRNLDFIYAYDGTHYSIISSDHDIIVQNSDEPIEIANYDNRRIGWSFIYSLRSVYDLDDSTIMPLISHVGDDKITTYANYITGQHYGTLPMETSNILENGHFAYIDNNGLYGLAHTNEAYWAGGTLTAKPTAGAVLVNKTAVTFDSYLINDNNYFKLRDLAEVLKGDAKGFAISWNEEQKAINMLQGELYTSVGTELQIGDGSEQAYTTNTATILLDNETIYMQAYTINGNTYFKLRDVCQVFDIGVTWDQSTQTIGINSDSSYATK